MQEITREHLQDAFDYEFAVDHFKIVPDAAYGGNMFGIATEFQGERFDRGYILINDVENYIEIGIDETKHLRIIDNGWDIDADFIVKLWIAMG
jgi:hypothetical protein